MPPVTGFPHYVLYLFFKEISSLSVSKISYTPYTHIYVIEFKQPRNLRRDHEIPVAILLARPSAAKLCPKKTLRRDVFAGGVATALNGAVNSGLRWLSDALEIRETATAGKHAVATVEIHPGDILIAEPPLASCLLPEFYGTHCQHCYAR